MLGSAERNRPELQLRSRCVKAKQIPAAEPAWFIPKLISSPGEAIKIQKLNALLPIKVTQN